jgi:septal ring factor EnvC (AmiA/AmiB activator)
MLELLRMQQYLGLVTVTLLVSGCATTTDPYACANRGVGAVFCQDDVAEETKARKSDLDRTNRDIADITKTNEEKRAIEAELQNRVTRLKSRLTSQRDGLTDLQSQLNAQRAANAVSQERYETLSSQLTEMNKKIDHFENLDNIAYAEQTADDLEYFLDTETVVIRKEIVEGKIG